MSALEIPEEYDTPQAACSLCGEKMIFIGRSKYGTPLFFCDNQQEGEKMPDDGYAWRNLLRDRIRESDD